MIDLIQRRREMMGSGVQTPNPNLLSGVRANGAGTAYRFAWLDIADVSSIEVGETVTLQIKLTEALTSTRYRVDIFFDGSHALYFNHNDAGKNLITTTVQWSEYGTQSTLSCYGLPQNTGIAIAIDWAKLERGSTATAFDGYAT